MRNWGGCSGDTILGVFRYCDDFVICCQYDCDTERIMRVLGKRLSKFGLKLNEDKTRLVPYVFQMY